MGDHRDWLAPSAQKELLGIWLDLVESFNQLIGWSRPSRDGWTECDGHIKGVKSTPLM